ncbi:hypothetical protein SKAU_G00323910 [Synaphobranchus kaupii]|uniref:GRAM domain-containing protein 1B n=1 Tax=Synaphobranchus kaupii TaxID=118154 RepID=A0A9Q1IHX4_SYNKA|nr:hypothetical protein SKAU_G00323910 [Synaphobranchus kaupii]
MTDTLQLPALQFQGDCSDVGAGMVGGAEEAGAAPGGHTPSLRRKRFKMRRMKNVLSEREGPEGGGALRRAGSGPGSAPSSTSKEYLQLPSIEITPSSDEDAPWSNCSTPSASPRRKRCLLKKWLRVREKKDCSESSSQQSSLQSSHEDDSTRFLTPYIREESPSLLRGERALFDFPDT